MASIKIETGLKTYDIEDEHGNVRGQISFNPADINIYPRAQEMQKNVLKWLEDLSLIENIDSDAEMNKKIEEVDKFIKDEVNKLFDDPNTSSVVFGNQNSLSTYKGKTFIERFLLAFIPIIKEETTKELNKSIKHAEKYTSQVTD